MGRNGDHHGKDRRPRAALSAAATLSGCAVVALSAAGGVAATEIEENDGKFDPLENTKAGQKLDALIN